MRRDWTLALAKVAAEACCRVCGRRRLVEAAHVLGRAYDDREPPGPVLVRAVDVVPLCRACHRSYDAHQLDLVPYLSLEEQAAAAGHVGLVRALARCSSLAKPSPERVSALRGMKGSPHTTHKPA